MIAASGLAPRPEPPTRTGRIAVAGLRLATYEWGDADGRPVVLAHGGGDFARSFDQFAPLLATAGYRVVAWDQRGHGDSDAATFYNWGADVFDAGAVFDSLGLGAAPVIGHSKGAMILAMLAEARPDLVSHFVSLDGFPTHQIADPRLALAQRLTEHRTWLDRHRDGVRHRRCAADADLVAQRRRTSQRVSTPWLSYLTEVGSDECAGGRRWKGDPVLRQLLSNPVDLTAPVRGMAGLAVPVLAILGGHREVIGMGTTASFARRFVPAHAELIEQGDCGHFVHVEHPERTAAIVLDFLRRHPAAV